MKDVREKTISSDFEEALDASEHLYGSQIQFYFDKKDVRQLLDRIEGYNRDICNRVQDILYYQIDKYMYLFV